MSKIMDWNVADRIAASNRKGIIIGLLIALVIILVVAIGIAKILWLKKHFGACNCSHIFDDDFLDDDDDDCCDEHGYRIANEKDFV